VNELVVGQRYFDQFIGILNDCLFIHVSEICYWGILWVKSLSNVFWLSSKFLYLLDKFVNFVLPWVSVLDSQELSRTNFALFLLSLLWCN
jgi:hypothetical protein